MMVTILWAISITLGLSIMLFVSLGYYVSQSTVRPRMHTMEYIESLRAKHNLYDLDWYNSLDKEIEYIQSEYGYKIQTTLILNPVPSDHLIIVCHGVTMRTQYAAKYLSTVHDMGYNALFVDHRAHGKTGGETVSYGYYEKHDLANIITNMRKDFSGRIGLLGESMGAGISMQAAALADVDFLIDDCGYSSFDEEVRHQIRRIKIIPMIPTYQVSRLIIMLRGKYDIEDVSSIRALANTKMPILIVHGTLDDYVPYYMADLIYRSISHDKVMLYTPEADHACAYQVDPQMYREKVKEFLVKNKMYYKEG